MSGLRIKSIKEQEIQVQEKSQQAQEKIQQQFRKIRQKQVKEVRKQIEKKRQLIEERRKKHHQVCWGPPIVSRITNDDFIIRHILQRKNTSPANKIWLGKRIECYQKIATIIPVEFFPNINGWSDYFGIKSPHTVILECLWYANAVYFIPVEEWEKKKEFTKKQMRESGTNRIIHSDNWEKEIEIVIQ